MDATQSEALNELATALATAQGEIEGAAKGKENPHFRSKYADLASIWDACRTPLSKHGLAVVQQPLSSAELVGLATTLIHKSGQWMRSEVWSKPAQPGPQALGSCLTYLRRYSLAAVVGVAPDDDDGNAAEGRGAEGKAGGRAGDGAATSGTAEKAKRADKVKASSDSVMATADQVTLIHTLKSKIGGMTEDQYRKGLAGYAKADGTPCTTSKELTEQQANNLIIRLRARVDRQKANLERPVDLGAMGGGKGANDNSTLAAEAKTMGLDLQEYILAPFGADTVDQLDPDDKPKALMLMLAFKQGREAYDRVMVKLGFPAGATP